MTHLIVSHGEFTPDRLAYILRWMADHVDEDEATTYTSDDLYGALSRLGEATSRKLAAADHIRGRRPAWRR